LAGEGFGGPADFGAGVGEVLGEGSVLEPVAEVDEEREGLVRRFEGGLGELEGEFAEGGAFACAGCAEEGGAFYVGEGAEDVFVSLWGLWLVLLVARAGLVAEEEFESVFVEPGVVSGFVGGGRGGGSPG